jgi:hypothetical protein
MRLVFLDTGTLGMVANPRGTAQAVECQRRAANLLTPGVRVFVPEIYDCVWCTQTAGRYHREVCDQRFRTGSRGNAHANPRLDAR